MSLEKPIIPTFSLEERDHRWSSVAPGNARSRPTRAHQLTERRSSGPVRRRHPLHHPDRRYQTEVGAVLPLEGDVTAVVRGARRNRMVGFSAGSGQRYPPVAPFLRRAGDRTAERNSRRARRRDRSVRSRTRARGRGALGNFRKDPPGAPDCQVRKRHRSDPASSRGQERERKSRSSRKLPTSSAKRSTC